LTNDDARFDVLTSFLFPSSSSSSSLFKYIVNAYTNVTQLVGNKLMDLFRSSHIFSR
jgi:type IV secretory pathway TrbL component